MPRIYELGLVVEPRQSDDDFQALIDKYSAMITEGESTAEITEVENWGKRKLAYPIQKYNEGKYAFIHVTSENAPTWPTIERLLMQDEKVLRHLVVRTDLDKKRAETRGKRRKPRDPERAAQAEQESEDRR